MPCIICSGGLKRLGELDFNRACEVERPVVGESIEYVQCLWCGIVYAPGMCAWSMERFREKVYNDEYVEVDPESTWRRAARNAEWMHRIFGKGMPSHLDYGGGNGAMVSLLRGKGWDSRSYDPMYDGEAPAGRYRLVSAFEVFEHCPDPRGLWAALMGFLAPDGVVVFTTALVDGIEDPLGWWYVAPRNGHVVIYSRRALDRLARMSRFRVVSVDQLLHIAFRDVPPWLEQLAAFSGNGHYEENADSSVVAPSGVDVHGAGEMPGC